LVPSHLIPIIQPILQRYKQHIRAPHTTSHSNARDNTRDRPDEIYVPTASVQRNVDFLKNMSAAAIWRNAPSTIRQGGSLQPPQKVKTPNLTATEDHHETNITSINNATPIRHGNPKNNGMAHPTESTNTRFNTPGHTSRQTPQPYVRPMDDNTTATFHSTASTTLNSSQNAQRFSELEASIKANQQNIRNMSKQHETMEARIIETMSSCHENTKQLVVMQGQLNNLQSTLQTIADQMYQITHHLAQPRLGQHDTENQMRSPAKKKLRQANNHTTSSQSSNHDEQQTDTEQLSPDMSHTQDPEAQHAPSPHVPNSHTHQTTYTQDLADQEDAQYNAPSSPGTAMEE
jgi:hypothetical protein